MKHLQRLGFAVGVLIAVGLGGCAATVSGGAYGPDLAYVGPGVQVIANYDEPIFYSDGYYWRPSGNGWYRSSYYTGGWVYARPPQAILRIDRPYAYRHYRPSGGHGYVARTAPQPAPHTGWRGGVAAPPPQRPPNAGWRGAPPQQVAPAARPPAALRPGPAPAPAAPRQQGRREPNRRGWR